MVKTSSINTTKKVFAKIFIFVMLALLYLPILSLMIFSFTESGTFREWSGFTINNYIGVFESTAIRDAVLNTIIIAVSASLIATLLGTLAAIGYNSLKKRTKAFISFANQIPVVNADIVTGIALMLLFVQMLSIGIKIEFGYFTLIIAHIVITTPYVFLSVLPRLKQINSNLYEAALDLGASPIKAMIKVMIPQLIPAMITGFALAFTLSLDDFVVTFFNSGTSSINTISTLIYAKAAKRLPATFRALSSIIFVVILGALLVINFRQNRLDKKNANK